MAESTATGQSWHAQGRPLLDGAASGAAIVLDEPLSFWGGLDAASGTIIDQRHPQRGQNVAGRLVVMPAGRGSSSSSSVLAEAIRAGRGPLGILMAEPDDVVVLGALVVQLLDGLTCPIVLLPPAELRRIRSGDRVQLSAGGGLVIEPARALT